MKASKTLARPENWPDFESLCKKLWGEIWQCPEIKKNGRAGQEQNGVDVYGIPVKENEYCSVLNIFSIFSFSSAIRTFVRFVPTSFICKLILN